MDVLSSIRGLMAAWIAASEMESRADVASSKISSAGSFSRALAIEIRWTKDGKLTAWAFVNPLRETEVALPEGNWKALMLNETIDPDGTQTLSGNVTVEGRTVLLVRAE